MIYIKKFIDKVSLMETRQGKDVVLPIGDARGLRDEIAKLLAEQHEENKAQATEEPVIKIEMKGGSFKNV